jgi:aquaporin Z
MNLKNKLLAEFFGTFWLVFGGCGSAVLAGRFFATEGMTPINLGIGLVGISLAFGLTVLTMAYAIGHISGCHLNPARSTGPALFVGGWALQQLWLFWLAPLLGAALAGVAYPQMAGKPDPGTAK